MKRLRASRRRMVSIGALTAVMVVFAAGYAYSATADTNNVYNGCLKAGTISNVTIAPATAPTCGKGAVPISWNQTGPPGQNGSNGTNGTNGTSVTSATEPAGTNCFEGGSKFTAANGVTYACNGAKGDKGDPGTNGTNGTNGKDGKDGKDGEPGFHPVVRWNFDAPATNAFPSPLVHGSTVFPAGTTLHSMSAVITGISDVPANCKSIVVLIGTKPWADTYLAGWSYVDVTAAAPLAAPAYVGSTTTALAVPSSLEAIIDCFDSTDFQNVHVVPGNPHVSGYITMNVAEGPFIIQ